MLQNIKEGTQEEEEEGQGSPVSTSANSIRSTGSCREVIRKKMEGARQKTCQAHAMGTSVSIIGTPALNYYPSLGLAPPARGYSPAPVSAQAFTTLPPDAVEPVLKTICYILYHGEGLRPRSWPSASTLSGSCVTPMSAGDAYGPAKDLVATRATRTRRFDGRQEPHPDIQSVPP